MFSLSTRPASHEAPSLPGAAMTYSPRRSVPSARRMPTARPFSTRMSSTKVFMRMSHFRTRSSYILLSTSREASVPICRIRAGRILSPTLDAFRMVSFTTAPDGS